MHPTHLDDREPAEVMPHFWGKFVHTEHATLAYWDIYPGAELPLHSHPHEQTVNLLVGEFELTVDGQTHLLRAGDVLVIPGNVPHSGRATSAPCRILDVFCPVREDYRAKFG
jgi:quercetin dioxygenase-like cupin family protein